MNGVQDRIIAVAVIVSTLGLGFILLSAISDYSLEGERRTITIDFERVDNIKANVSQIKLAGMPIGMVTSVRILSREERRALQDAHRQAHPDDKDVPNHAVRIEGYVDAAIPLTTNAVASIRQAGLMSEHYIELTPGPPQEGTIPPNFRFAGTSSKGLGDLMEPGSQAIENLKATTADIKTMAADLKKTVPKTVAKLEDIPDKLDKILEDAGKVTGKLKGDLPGAIDKLDAALENARELTENLNSEESRERLEDLIANLKVTSDNLKVVSTHAKLFTGTVAQRPWRIMFGGKGKANPLPDEKKILSTDKPITVTPTEDAN